MHGNPVVYLAQYDNPEVYLNQCMPTYFSASNLMRDNPVVYLAQYMTTR